MNISIVCEYILRIKIINKPKNYNKNKKYKNKIHRNHNSFTSPGFITRGQSFTNYMALN